MLFRSHVSQPVGPSRYRFVLVPMHSGVPMSAMPAMLRAAAPNATAVYLRVRSNDAAPVAFADLVQPAGGDVVVFAEGDPAAVIAGAAERLRCDLVVLPLRDTQLRRNVLALATFHWDVMLVDGGTPEERAT